MNEIFTRRSIRKYTNEPVSQEDITYLMKAAMAAPSAKNQQPWQFVVIDDRELLEKVPQFHPYSKMLLEAPLAIAVCGDLSGEYGGMWVQDCSAATQNILLAAESKGLGAVWLGIHPIEKLEQQVINLLNLPEGIIPLNLIAVGHPAEKKEPANRYHEAKVHYNKW
ncbi:nitroreductase family protein [Alkalicella caledoniensis]|uniref:Nitroreductase family protein n=1 Tax=Alkalicella caledoniensis TaxID=2731377 RepID=A0A7G9WBJ3_ALKCA|nr:nitroreductase family protein [Alkalicella caledoniensis]QNO16055.1 nitroreductase family protein [Alkalicella caledoniensis]